MDNYDDGREAKFTKEDMYVSKKGEKVLQQGVVQYQPVGLWDVTLSSSATMPHQVISQPTANVIIQKDKSKAELASFLHACAGSPLINSFIRAKNKGNFVTWPGIDSKSILTQPPL